MYIYIYTYRFILQSSGWCQARNLLHLLADQSKKTEWDSALPILMNISEAAKSYQELVKCGCKKNCSGRCKCKKLDSHDLDYANAVVDAQISIKAISPRMCVSVNFEHLILMLFQKAHKICNPLVYNMAIFGKSHFSPYESSRGLFCHERGFSVDFENRVLTFF